MRTIFLGLILLISITSFSQKKKMQVLSAERVLGKNLLTNSEIRGLQYTFPDRIHKTYLDTISGLLTVQLRGVSKNGKWLKNTGKILQYSLNNKEVKWSKKIAYQVSSVQQFSNTMIFTAGNKSYCLDINTGNKLWDVKNDIYFVDPIYNIGIGYKFKTFAGYTNELEGIDLKTGNVVWKKELNREYGWNDVFYINDSTVIVVAAGLHAINIKNGKGWDYNAITGQKDYTGNVAANTAGAALGLLTGTFVISTGYKLVRDVVSNAMGDSTHIYFSSKEQLVKIDKQSGEVAWKYPLPKDFTSKSLIFMNDSLIFMVNMGYAFMGYRKLDFGMPFIAAYDKENGNQKYLSTIIVKKDPILGFYILDREIYLVFKNRISKYSLEEGRLISEENILKEEFGELKYFVSNNVFITHDNEDFRSLRQSDSTKVFVFTNQGKVLAIDKQLNVSYTIEEDDLSLYYLRTKDYKFIAKDKHTWIINNKGKRVAEIDASSNAFLLGNILYDRQEDSFFAIDLKNILESE